MEAIKLDRPYANHIQKHIQTKLPHRIADNNLYKISTPYTYTIYKNIYKPTKVRILRFCKLKIQKHRYAFRIFFVHLQWYYI